MREIVDQLPWRFQVPSKHSPKQLAFMILKRYDIHAHGHQRLRHFHDVCRRKHGGSVLGHFNSLSEKSPSGRG